MSSVIVYFFCAAIGLRRARNSGAITANGTSSSVSSISAAVEGDGGGLINERSRFQGRMIFPRFNACSISSEGNAATASGVADSACRIGSGHEAMSLPTGTTKGSEGAAAGAGAGAASGRATGAGVTFTGAPGSGWEGRIGWPVAGGVVGLSAGEGSVGVVLMGAGEGGGAAGLDGNAGAGAVGKGRGVKAGWAGGLATPGTNAGGGANVGRGAGAGAAGAGDCGAPGAFEVVIIRS